MEVKLFSLNLNRPFGDFQRAMQRSLDLVALGLLAQDVEVESLELPGFPHRDVGSHLPEETLREEYPRWLIGHGLNDCVEALEPLLLEVWRACHLPKVQTGEVSKESLRDLLASLEANQFSGKPLGQKIDALRREFPDVFSPDWEASLRALNKLRVCLTHAGGVVRKKDCTTESSLEVGLLWREVVFVDEEGNEHVVTKGMHTKTEGYIGIKTTRTPKVVQIGERVDVGPSEFLGICETLLRFAVELRQAVLDYLKKYNLVPPEFRLEPPQYKVHVTFGPPEQEDSTGVPSEASAAVPTRDARD